MIYTRVNLRKLHSNITYKVFQNNFTKRISQYYIKLSRLTILFSQSINIAVSPPYSPFPLQFLFQQVLFRANDSRE